MMLLSVKLSWDVRKILVEQAVSEAEYNMDRVEERLNEYVSKGIDISTTLYFDSVLEQIAVTEFKNEHHRNLVFNSYDAIDDFVHNHEEIHSIQVYVWNETLPRTDYFVNISEGLDSEEWFKLAVERDGRIGLVSHFDFYQNAEVLTLVRSVKDIYGETIGILMIRYDKNGLSEIVRSESLENSVIMNREQVVLSSVGATGNEAFNDNYEIIIENGQRLSVVDAIEGRQQVILQSFMLDDLPNEFHIMSLIPLVDIQDSVNKEIVASMMLIVGSIVVSGIVIFMLTRAFSNRLYLFKKDLHKVVEGETKLVSSIEGNDEIGELSKDLNVMIESMHKLIHEAYEARLQKEMFHTKQKDAEFKMLASQINPHFLYNTLETVRMKAMVQGNIEIADIVMKLSRIMRRNLSFNGETVSLQSELTLIKDYSEIQRFRYRDKIRMDMHVHCDVEGYEVLPLLIQPLVENAFIHGHENNVKNGHITIYIFEENEKLVIRISDDGVGMTEERIQQLNEKLQNGESRIDGSIGILNVNQRIRMYYGETYGLSVDSRHNNGTNVIIHLPLKGADKHV